jgi:hypothetical protein
MNDVPSRVAESSGLRSSEFQTEHLCQNCFYLTHLFWI